MLKGYTRYLLRNLIGPTVFITLSLTAIIWLTQSLRFIDMIVNRGLSISTFLYLTGLLLPSLLGIVLPIALFIAVLYAYNKLIIDSELLVLESAGLSKVSLAKPALMLGIAGVLIGYAISLYLLPASYREFKDFQAFIRNNYASVLLQEEVFNTPISGLTVYIRERSDDGSLKGILVHDNRDPERPVTMMAQEGRLVQGENGPRFLLISGNRQAVNRDQGQLSLLNFDRYTLDISIYAEAEEIRWREPEERYLHELLNPGAKTPPHLRPRLIAEAHQRLTWPLYTLALPMIALSALFSGQFNRRGQWRRITGATIAAVITIGLALAARNLAAKSTIYVLLMYLVVFNVMAVSIYYFIRSQLGVKARFRPEHHTGGAG